jgi:hypothetical protein
MIDKQIKSKKRVKELAEVYTNEREVINMLDLIPIKSAEEQLSYTYLEPACGNGNFLIKILERKLNSIKNYNDTLKQDELLVLKAVSTIYGIDICPENVFESKERLFNGIKSYLTRNKEDMSEYFIKSINYILNKNIVVGNSIDENNQIIFNDIGKEEMKFNVIIGNPPFFGKSATHQKMFNRGVDRLKEGGYICFIQPSTTYHNKKKFSKKEEQIMYDNVSKFKTIYVEMLSPYIFKGVDINNDISITLLEKIESNNGKIDKIKYKNNEIYEDILLEDISMTEINPSIYSSIKSKYFKYIKNNGSLYDISYFDKTNTLNNNSAGISTIRGHKDNNGELKNDFFTFLSRNDLDKKVGSKHYINCNSSEIINVHNYLMTKFSRFSLTFLKFNSNLHMGELRAVPKVDISKKWTDEELYDLIRLTKEERKIIDNYIPEWNHYGK